MDNKQQLEAIKARYADDGLTEEQWDNMSRSEMARIRADCKRMLVEFERSESENMELRAEIEQLRKERDAAVGDLGYHPCEICRRGSPLWYTRPCSYNKGDKTCFAWRGLSDGEE